MDAVEARGGKLAAKDPEKWTVEEVCKWLAEIGLDQYTDNFKQHHIDGAELLALNQDSLQAGIKIGKSDQ